MQSSIIYIPCGKIAEENVDKKVETRGFIHRFRNHGSIIFVDLRDRTGILQVVFDPSINKETALLAEKLKNESSVTISGTIKLRDEKTVNSEIQTGKFELLAEDLKIHNIAASLPFQINDDTTEIDEELRLKYRYLDLRKPSMHKKLAFRHKLIFEIRKFMDEEGFYEIETPILTKNTPEGAREFIVPSRIKKGSFFSLPQSPQLYKQLLMAGGMEKYFQIAKCFRDEDLRADRQFEFTQLDVEMAYAKPELIQELMEKLFKNLFKKFLNFDIELPIQKMTYDYAFKNYGSDKPDIRFDLKINDFTEIFKNINLEFIQSTIKADGKIGGIITPKRFSRSELDEFLNYITQQGGKGLLWIRKSEDGKNIESPVSKFLPLNFIEEIENKIGRKIETNETIFVMAGDYKKTWTFLGRLRIHVANFLNLINSKIYKFLWVIDFPLFEYNEEEKRWDSVHHPFTRPCDGWEDKKTSEITAVSYDMVLNGIELGGGSIRIHEKELQEKIFEFLGLDRSKMEDKFGFLLKAQELGFPPHGGIAFGIDRVAMLMSGCSSIRDIIAFPKTQKGDPLMEGPSEVSDLFLREYGIKKTNL